MESKPGLASRALIFFELAIESTASARSKNRLSRRLGASLFGKFEMKHGTNLVTNDRALTKTSLCNLKSNLTRRLIPQQ